MDVLYSLVYLIYFSIFLDLGRLLKNVIKTDTKRYVWYSSLVAGIETPDNFFSSK